MDPSLLTKPAFWSDPAPVFMGEFPSHAPDDSRLADHVMFATSGSFGKPKWIALSKPALLASAEAVNRHLHVTSASRWGLALPIHHVGGFGVAARSHAAACGFSTFGRRWDAAAFCDWLAVENPTHISLVPTQVHDLVAGGHHAPESVRVAIVGGGSLDEPTGLAARSMGWPVLASYGMTEACSQVATQGLEALETPYQPAPISILPHWLVRVDDDGRILLQGPSLFSGVLLPDEGSWIYQERPRGWFATSDRGRIENGQLTPCGRIDQFVKVLGELVNIGEIETKLALAAGDTMPPGSFAVVPVPDERAGHALVPVFESAMPPATVAAALENYQLGATGLTRLRKPVFLAELPKSPLGKILRSELYGLVTGLLRES